MAENDPRKRLSCVLGDITLETTDAIVNAANSALRGGGGVDGAIHAAAGPGLFAECRERYPGGCPTGEVRMTGGHELKARYVIHAVGPIWRGGGEGEAELLAGCYRSSIEVARDHGLESLAFPAISCGVYGYPWQEAAEIAVGALRRAVGAAPGIREVRLVLFSEELLEVFEACLDPGSVDG